MATNKKKKTSKISSTKKKSNSDRVQDIQTQTIYSSPKALAVYGVFYEAFLSYISGNKYECFMRLHCLK